MKFFYGMERCVFSFVMMVGMVLCLTSCHSWRNFTYMQDATDFENLDIKTAAELQVRKGDVLYIFVSSRNPESARPFNLLTMGNSGMSSESSLSAGGMYTLGYQVDELGDIEFPQLGAIHCEGMTRRELSDYIKGELIKNDFLKDPIVTIDFQNLKITVLGEVARPGSYPMTNNHATLLEALGQAGDLTAYGRRDRVAVIREVDGKRTIVYHDLRSKELFNSPRYYLQQNDIVYVEPNKAKATQSDVNRWNQPGFWFSCVSTLISLVTFLKLSL